MADVIRGTVDAMHAELTRLAHEKLMTSTEDYVQGIQPPVFHLPAGRLPAGEQVVASIVLVGWLPNAIENGYPGGDMKEGLLSGRNMKMTAKGVRYNTVPFRHGTPGTSGRNFPPMGAAYKDAMGDEDAARMGKRVHRAAKKLTGTRTHPGASKTDWGGRLAAGTGGAGLLRPHHKTDIYAGMVRQEKTYKKATQSSYHTFRRVSDNSDPRSWMHPGIEGKHLFKDVADYAPEAAARLVRAALAGMGS
ncbi:MAG: hypothetical protein CMB99_01400 [Flavobacteriaceae bacterium]|nr:hypothetical protein [Flavobacteriaceae bacterium]